MAEAKKVTTKKAASKKTAVKTDKASPKIAKKELKTAEKSAVKETTKKIDELIETEKLAEAIIEAEKELDAEDKPLAKAGKRSPKAIKEAEIKAAKEERKAHLDETIEKPKIKPVKARSRLERKGKKYRKVADNIQTGKEYNIKEALDLAIKTSTTKFDSSVDMHIRLGVDPRQADQNIRASIVLPSGTGKKIVVAVFADTDDIEAAKKAGADIALGDELLQKLDKNIIDFDVLISTPSMMQKLGKYARVLGPKGLMPSPKSGTVTSDVTKAVSEAKAGRVEYRVDSTGIVHVAIGKASFGTDKLLKNATFVLSSIKGAKPASIKGNYVKSIYVATSMGPSIKIVSTEM
jgi:large subunit ribosomal protein L1